MSTYSDWTQRQLDVTSGEEFPSVAKVKSIVDSYNAKNPHEGYHRIDTAELGLNPKGMDVEYYLARLEGQFARMEALLDGDLGDGNFSTPEAQIIVTTAKMFLSALRLALEPHRYDVA